MVRSKQMPSVKLPKSLLTTIQTAFKLEAKRLCRDIATILQKPEKELIEKVLQSQCTLQILEDNDETHSCPILIRHSVVLERCRRPCLLGTGLCIHHQSTTTIPEVPSSLKTLTRIECSSDHTAPLWCDETTGYVYGTDGAQVGWYKNERLTLVEFEEEEETI